MTAFTTISAASVAQYYTPSPLTPAPYGLLDASTIIPSGDYVHMENGVILIPVNTGGAWGNWPVQPCLNPDAVENVHITGGSTGKQVHVTIQNVRMDDASGAVDIAWDADAATIEAALVAAGFDTLVTVTVNSSTDHSWRIEFTDKGYGPVTLAATGDSGLTVVVATTSVGLIKWGERAPFSDPFMPVMAWGYDECDPSTPEPESRARAEQLLKLHYGLQAEEAFGAEILSMAGSPAAADDIDDAIGMLEEWLGEQGPLGFIHASRRYASLGANAQNVLKQGNGLFTPLGNRWVFGAGYTDVLDTTLVATLPTLAWVFNPLETRSIIDIRDGYNRRISVAEQPTIVAVEGSSYAVTVTIP